MAVESYPVTAPVLGSRLSRIGRPHVRTTFQLAADLLPKSGQAVDELMADVTSVTVQWLQERFPDQLPAGATRGEPFDSEIHGQAIQCIAIPERGIWTARLVHPDGPHRGRPAVPGRTWTSELALSRRADAIRFGIRVQCASLAYADEAPELTRPRVVVDLSNQFAMRESSLITGTAWAPSDETQLEQLFSLLTDPNRGLPVILLTQPDPASLPFGVKDFLLDHNWLARRLVGVAFVVTMPASLGYAWTELVGKPWSAFWGAVRTYRPGLDFERDSPSAHPLALTNRILGFQYNGQTMERAFEEFLVDRAFEYAATRRVDWHDCVFYADARIIRAELGRVSAAEAVEWRTAFEEESTSLKSKLDERTSERDQALDMATDFERERDQVAVENRTLRSRVASLESALKVKTGKPIDEDAEAPSLYDDLPEWVTTNLAGRVVFHPRAINKGLKHAQFESLPRVCDALVLLATEYRDMRLGETDARGRFESGLAELGLRFDGSISKERAGQEGDTYFVNFPYSTSPRRFVEFHLRSGGNSREPRRCLAIYFFWDDESQQVVVCWLPSHLDNRFT